MLPFRPDKSKLSPLKKGTSPRIDCRSLFPAEAHAEKFLPKENELSRRNEFFEQARKSTRDIMLHGAPLPLVWVPVSDNIMPDYAVPLSEAYGGPQFIARAFLEGQYCIGKAGTGLPHGALITYGARQLTVKRYEVLCFATEMRWNIAEKSEYFQQSSYIVSHTTRSLHSSMRGSRTEISASMLLDSDILRVVAEDGNLGDMSARSYCSSLDGGHCRSPLSPISRHLIEEMCASETESTKMNPQFGRNVPKSILPARQNDAASQSFSTRVASQTLHRHAYSLTFGRGSPNVDRSPILRPSSKLSPTLFAEGGRVREVHWSNAPAAQSQTPRSAPTGLTINEDTHQSHRQPRPLSPLLPARLAGSLRVDTTLEEDTDSIRTQDIPLATNPRVNQCLSPITHFSLPEPFSDSADSTPTLSPMKQAGPIELTIKRSHQGFGNDVFSSRPIPSKPSSVPRVSSPLTGGRQSPGPGLPGPRNRRSSYHIEHIHDNKSFSDTDIGSLSSSTRATLAARLAQQNWSERSSNSTWAAVGSREVRPHTRPALREMSPIRMTGRSIEQSLSDVREKVVDSGLSSTTIVANRDYATQNIRDGRTQGPSSSIVELRPSLVSVSSAEFSARSSHQPKGDKSVHLQPPTPSISVPLIIVSPTIDHRELPESPHTGSKPLGVSLRDRLSTKVVSSEQREASSNVTSIIASTLSAAAVVGAIASSPAHDSPAASHPMVMGAHQDHRATARSSGDARGIVSTLTVQDTPKDQAQPLSETRRTGKPAIIGSGRLGVGTQEERAKLDVRASGETRLDITPEEPLAARGKDGRRQASIPAGPQLSGRELRAMRPIVEHAELEETDRRLHVPAIGKSAVKSSHENIVQVQLSHTDNVLDGTTIVESASQEVSRLDNGAARCSSTLYEDKSAEDTADRMGFCPQDIEMKMSDSFAVDGDTGTVQGPNRLPSPFVSTKVSRVENDTKSSLEVSGKVTVPVDTGCRPARREAERQAGAVALDYSWKGARKTTPPNTRPPYRVPLSDYLQVEGDANGALVTSRERNEIRLRETQENGHRRAIEGTRGTQDTRTLKEYAKANEVVANKDGSNATKATPSKKEDSVGSAVSAVLAAACVATVALETVSESHYKERGERAEDKADTHGKVALDRNCLAVRERAGIVEDDQTLVAGENAIVNVAHEVAPADSSVATEKTRASTSAVVSLGNAQCETGLTSGQRSSNELSQDKSVQFSVDGRAVDAQVNLCITAKTEQYVDRDAVSTRPIPSAKERVTCDLSSDQTPAELRDTVQSSERTWKENELEERSGCNTQLSGSRETWKGTLAKNDLTAQCASFDAINVPRASNESIKCAIRGEEQSALTEECKTECQEDQFSQAQPSPTLTPSQACTIVLSPQVNVTIQQTVASNDTVRSMECTSKIQQEQRTECFARSSEVDVSSTDAAETLEVCVAENSSTQTSIKCAEVEHVACKTDVRDAVIEQTYELTTYTNSSYSETSQALVMNEKQPCQPNGNTTTRQDALVQDLDGPTTASVALKQWNVESSVMAKVPLFPENTPESIQSQSHDTKGLLEDCAASVGLSYQTSTTITSTPTDCQSAQHSTTEACEVVAKEVCADDERMLCHYEDVHSVSEETLETERFKTACDSKENDRSTSIPPSASPARPELASLPPITLADGGNFVVCDAFRTEKHTLQVVDIQVEPEVRQEHFMSQTSISHQAAAVVQTHDAATVPLTSTSRVSADKAVLQTNTEVTLQRDDIQSVIGHADCAISFITAAIAAGETLTVGDTASTEARRQQAQLESGESAATQEYDIRRQGIVSGNGYISDHVALPNNTSMTVTGPRQRSLTSRGQQPEKPDRSTSECRSVHIPAESNGGLESSSESALCEQPSDYAQTSLRTERTSTTQMSSTVALEGTKGITSSRHSTDLPNPWRPQRPASVDGSFAVQSLNISGSSSADPLSITRAKTLCGVSASFPENSSSPILCDSPTEYTKPEIRRIASLGHEMHISAIEDAKHTSELSTHTDNPRSGNYEDVSLDLRVVDSPASSLSTSPLTPTAGREPSVGKRQLMESKLSDCQDRASSGPGEQTRSSNDYEWRDSWVQDNKEPPPSYQDAISDYDKSPVLSTDALPLGGRQSSGRNVQFCGDEQSTTVGTTDEFGRQSEAGASVLEVHRRESHGRIATNDSALGESVPLPIEVDDVHETHLQISLDVMGATSKATEGVLGQCIEASSRKYASSSIKALAPSSSIPSHKAYTMSTTNSFQEVIESPHQQLQGRAATTDTWVDAAESSITYGLSTVKETQRIPTLEAIAVNSGTRVESIGLLTESPLPVLATLSGEKTNTSSSNTRNMEASLNYADEYHDESMSDESFKRIENEKCMTSTIGSDEGLSLAGVDVSIHEQHASSQASLPPYTVENERQVVAAMTQGNVTGNEETRSHLVNRTTPVQTTQSATSNQESVDDTDSSASTIQTSAGVIQATSNLSGSLTGIQTLKWRTAKSTSTDDLDQPEHVDRLAFEQEQKQTLYISSSERQAATLADNSSESTGLHVGKQAGLALEVRQFKEVSLNTTCITTTSTEFTHVESVHSPAYISSQEIGNFCVSTTESESTTWTSNANGHGIKISRHRVPSLDYMEEFKREWVGVDLYDLAECGVLYRCLSRPFFIHTRVMQYWKSLREQETVEGSEELGSVVACHYSPLGEASIFAVAKMEWRLDVLGASRLPSIVRGWGCQMFVYRVSLANRLAHIIGCHLYDNDRPWAVVRTSSSSNGPRSIVIAIASAAGTPFDRDALAARILVCTGRSISTPQDLWLLCIVPLKTREMVAALNETLFAVKDILRHRLIEVKSVSSNELDRGYWVKVTVQKSSSLSLCMGHGEERALYAVEQVDVEVLSSQQGAVTSGAKSNAPKEALVGIVRRWF